MKSPFLNSVAEAVRVRHYSIRTEQAYLMWIKQFIVFHERRHPSELNAGHVEAFLTHLAVKRNVSAGTQSQALCAIVFMYRHVLDMDLGDFSAFTQAKKPKKLPVVLTQKEVAGVLSKLKGVNHLLACLMYGYKEVIRYYSGILPENNSTHPCAGPARDGGGAAALSGFRF